jgi:CRP-like cAMP-binding protein
LKTDKKNNETVSSIREGAIFGEIALLTKLKRTATVKSTDYTGCAFITKTNVRQMEEHFPHIVQQMREKIKDYGDNKMEFRRLMIRNLHYLQKLND